MGNSSRLGSQLRNLIEGDQITAVAQRSVGVGTDLQMSNGQDLCADVAQWGAKAALFSTGLLPALESLGKMEYPGEEIAKVALMIQELTTVDENQEFNG